MLGPAPLQGEQQADNSRDEHRRPRQIKPQDPFQKREPLRVINPVDLEEEEYRRHGERSDGEVDVKTPPPPRVGRITERPPQQRTGDGADPPHPSYQPERGRPFPQWQGVAQNHNRSREQTRGAHTGNGPPSDKGVGGGGDGADERADFKDEDGDEVGVFDGEHAVEGAVAGLEGGGGEEVAGAVPANVPHGGELGRDGAEGGGDDCLVEGYQEDGEAEGGDDEVEFWAGGVDHVGVVSGWCWGLFGI